MILLTQEIRIKHLNILANPAKAGDAKLKGLPHVHGMAASCNIGVSPCLFAALRGFSPTRLRCFMPGAWLEKDSQIGRAEAAASALSLFPPNSIIRKKYERKREFVTMTTEKMYELAFRFRDTKLWQKLYDDEMFAVRLTDCFLFSSFFLWPYLFRSQAEIFV